MNSFIWYIFFSNLTFSNLTCRAQAPNVLNIAYVYFIIFQRDTICFVKISLFIKHCKKNKKTSWSYNNNCGSSKLGLQGHRSNVVCTTFPRSLGHLFNLKLFCISFCCQIVLLREHHGTYIILLLRTCCARMKRNRSLRRRKIRFLAALDLNNA